MGAGFRLADEDLAGYVVLDFDAFDDWYEEDERIAGHPRDPFHRVDVRRSARPVRIEVGGDVVAETTRARLLFETSLPMRFYLPREDVRLELHPSSRRTYCPYKGEASYWSVDAGGRRRKDLGWSYEQPLPDIVAIPGLVAFWDERVDVFVDGERRERPGGPISDALRDEFGVQSRARQPRSGSAQQARHSEVVAARPVAGDDDPAVRTGARPRCRTLRSRSRRSPCRRCRTWCPASRCALRRATAVGELTACV